MNNEQSVSTPPSTGARALDWSSTTVQYFVRTVREADPTLNPEAIWEKVTNIIFNMSTELDFRHCWKLPFDETNNFEEEFARNEAAVTDALCWSLDGAWTLLFENKNDKNCLDIHVPALISSRDCVSSMFYMSNSLVTAWATQVKTRLSPMIQYMISEAKKNQCKDPHSKVMEQLVGSRANNTWPCPWIFARIVESSLKTALCSPTQVPLYPPGVPVSTSTYDFPQPSQVLSFNCTGLKFRLCPVNNSQLFEHNKLHVYPTLYQTNSYWPRTAIRRKGNNWHVTHWTSRITRKHYVDLVEEVKCDCNTCTASCKSLKGMFVESHEPKRIYEHSDAFAELCHERAVYLVRLLTFQLCHELASDWDGQWTLASRTNKIHTIIQSTTKGFLHRNRGFSTTLRTEQVDELPNALRKQAGYNQMKCGSSTQSGSYLMLTVNFAPATGFWQSYWEPCEGYKLESNHFSVLSPSVFRARQDVLQTNSVPFPNKIEGTSHTYSSAFAGRVANFLNDVDKMVAKIDDGLRAVRLEKAYEWFVKEQFTPSDAGKGKKKSKSIWSFNDQGLVTSTKSGKEPLSDVDGPSALTVEFGTLRSRSSRVSWDQWHALNTLHRENVWSKMDTELPDSTEAEQTEIRSIMSSWVERNCPDVQKPTSSAKGQNSLQAKKSRGQESKQMDITGEQSDSQTTQTEACKDLETTTQSDRRSKSAMLAEHFLRDFASLSLNPKADGQTQKEGV